MSFQSFFLDPALFLALAGFGSVKEDLGLGWRGD